MRTNQRDKAIEGTTAERAVTIVYGVDNRFARALAASIESALDHLGGDHWLDIHIIDGGLTRRNLARIDRSFAQRACRLSWHRPEDRRLRSLKVGGAITVATYYRLLIPDLLPTQDKAIYLDADLVVRGDLAALWRLPVGDRHLLAVQDQGVRLVSGPYGLSNYQSLGIPSSAKYFNAGVLVLNLAKWRREGTAQAVVDYVRDHHEHIRFHDQDGLNAILWNSWGELHPRWNQMAQFLKVRSSEEGPFDADTHRAVASDPQIVHFSSADKPWRFGCQHPAAALFFGYLDRTEFRGYRPTRWRTDLTDALDAVGMRVRRLASALLVRS
jgi:lipopolysaccharide biosynthesis glycosyltransferase